VREWDILFDRYDEQEQKDFFYPYHIELFNILFLLMMLFKIQERRKKTVYRFVNSFS
jgi:hypothetical protein